MRLALLVTLASSLLSASPIADLFNSGASVLDGTDLHWKVNGTPAFVTDPTQYPFPAWIQNPGAGWLSPQAHYVGNSDNADTTFIFSTVFRLPAQFESAFIVMQVASDNGLLDVKLNGTSVPLPKSDMVLPGNTAQTRVVSDATGFSGLGSKLDIRNGFQSGENTLEFYVRNSITNLENDGNPAGMMAIFSSDVIGSDESESPEPASFVLLAIGFGFIGSAAAVRRKRRA